MTRTLARTAATLALALTAAGSGCSDDEGDAGPTGPSGPAGPAVPTEVLTGDQAGEALPEEDELPPGFVHNTDGDLESGFEVGCLPSGYAIIDTIDPSTFSRERFQSGPPASQSVVFSIVMSDEADVVAEGFDEVRSQLTSCTTASGDLPDGTPVTLDVESDDTAAEGAEEQVNVRAAAGASGGDDTYRVGYDLSRAGTVVVLTGATELGPPTGALDLIDDLHAAVLADLPGG